jgi:PAS domain S-box-containing protein
MRRDVRGRITFFNEFAQKFFGWREEEILGRSVVGTIVPEKDATGKDLKAMIRDIGEHPERYEVNENENRCRDGRRVWIAWTNRAIRDREGRVTEVLCVGNDITERKLLQEQLLQSKKMEAVGRLAGGIAHDFDNLLTAILSSCETMLTNIDREHPWFHKVEQIRQAGERGARLTRQLLEFSRKKALQPRVLDLNAVVANQEETLRRILGEEAELELDMDVRLGYVEADPGSMEQVIMHLAANAAEAMSRGGRLTVRTRNADPGGDLPPGPYVELTISDTGVGMNGETKAHLFEPFFTTKKEGKGAGLGLATVYGIVKQHLGHVRVTSEPGRGTAFQVYLPRLPRGSEACRAATRSAAAFRDMETVLLVEEGEQARGEFCEALEKRGYTVLAAGDSSEAILVCRRYQGPIHLMVTEVVMPKLSGYELAEFLGPIRPDMKVLYLSGEGQEAAVPHAGCCQEATFLKRPVTPESLSRTIRRVLDGAG